LNDIARALAQADAREAALFAAAPDPLVSVGTEGRITGWNAAAEAVFGYSSAQAIGQPLVELIIPPRLHEQHLRGFARLLAAGEPNMPGGPIETWARRSDDSEIPVAITVARVRLDGPAAFIAYVRDLSERRRGEAELGELMARAREAQTQAELERNRLREVFDNSPYLVLVTAGPEHHVLFTTRSALDVFRAPSDVQGKPLAQAYPEFAQLGYLQLFSQVYQTGKVLSGREIPLTNRGWGDAVKYFDCTFQALRDEHGEITGVVAHGIEVTDKVSARQQLEQALRARDDFVSLAAHELRNPLNTLQLQIASTALRLKPTAEPLSADGMRERLERMARTTGVLAGLIDRLLDVSRMVSGLRLEPEEFDLGVLAKGVADRMMADDAGGSETNIRRTGSLRVNWDRQRIDDVISNLLANAYKYGAGKPVELQLEGLHDSVRLEVHDRGPGIPAADQQRIFDRFEQVPPRLRMSIGGLGLGLWICRQIVAAHGGRIWVECPPGEGARFIAELPRNPDPSQPTFANHLKADGSSDEQSRE
jgi:PAS domain S-box-containing protein